MKSFKVTIQTVLIFCVVSTVSSASTVDSSAKNAAENVANVPSEIVVKVLDEFPAKVNADISEKVPADVSAEVSIDVSTNNATAVSTDGSTEPPTNIEILCGAAGSCHLIGGGTLCNDRCKRCSGPSGPYTRGECCGLLWQTCCCLYG